MPTTKRDLDKMNEHLLGIIGHDLRGPITVIKLTGEALLRADGELPEIQRLGLLRIVRVAMRASRMLGSLLDLAQLRDEKLVLHKEQCSMKKLVHRLVEDLEILHPACKFEIHREGHTSGNWDGQRLERAVSNILTNACEHKDDGEPVKISITENSGWVVLEVGNKTEPLPEAALKNIWDPFSRSETNHHSVGLGLFITKLMVEAHGGRVEVEQKPGDWIFFRLYLPQK